ncbi:RNA polymerase sigma factor, partial [Asanoa siamensis]
PAAAAPDVGQQLVAAPEQIKFYEDHFGRLVSLGVLIGASPYEAEEVAAAVLLEIVQRWGLLREPLAYAVHAVRSGVAKLRGREGLARARQLVAAGEFVDADEGVVDLALLVWEDREWLMQYLETLPEGQRQVMALLVDGYEPGEIAAVLGITPEAARNRAFHARLRLRRRYNDERVETAAQAPTGSTREEAL